MNVFHLTWLRHFSSCLIKVELSKAMMIFIALNLLAVTACDRQTNKTLQDPPLTGIGIYMNNPFYWQYDQKPVMLIGGSVKDNLFQIRNPEQHLDLLRSVGGNYVRCTMSSRDSGNFKPYYQENELYDLDHWNVGQLGSDRRTGAGGGTAKR
ncbi:hypothetical protein GF407_02840 [candidate division KSB1 bacterium]|nr:hypothetical protein [candidate division KSB1 bacterium]